MRHLYTFFLLSLALAHSATAQMEIKLGKNKLTTSETFQIALVVSNESVQNMSGFPNIPNLRKIGSSQSTSMQIINGKATSTFTIIQEYIPEKAGDIKIKPFEMKVNGKKVVSQGTTLKISKSESRDPFAMFFDEKMHTKDDAAFKSFLAFSVDKKEVYVGEGFKTTLAFYKHISEKNLLDFDYASFNVQRAEISRKLRPSNCWEEKYEKKHFEDRIQINGELYIKEVIGQSYLFPMNQDSIIFPSINLRMEKKGIISYGNNVKRLKHDGYKIFSTQPIEVKVKPLPPHPLSQKVNVGKYKLVEYVDTMQTFRTGNSFIYKLRIVGNGNIASLKEMPIPKNKGLNFFLSETDQQIVHTVDTIYGARDFTYHVEPVKPGKYQLKDFVEWIYFNPETEKYDTLNSSLQIPVIGEPIEVETITTAYDEDAFYASIDNMNNQLNSNANINWSILLSNIIAIVGLATLVAFNYQKKKKSEEPLKREGGNPFL